MATAVKRISAPSSAQIEDVLVAVGLGDWLDKSKTRIFLKSVPTLQAVRISLDASLQLAPERATISAVRLGQPAAVQSILAARERSGKEQARVHFRSGSRPEWIDIDSLNVVGQEKARNLFSVDIDTAAKKRRRPRSDRKLASQKQRKAKRVHSRVSYSQANYVQQKSSESDETTSENRSVHVHQLRMYMGGSAGSGKTHVIRAIQDLFRVYGKLNWLRVAASTGAAAKHIGGRTLHSLLDIPRYGLKSEEAETRDDSYKRGNMAVEGLGNGKFFIFDRPSTISTPNSSTAAASSATVRE